MAPPLITLQDITLTLGGAPLLSGAELIVAPGDRIALVGRNGSGKSTLLKVAAGQLVADSGRRFLQPGATLRYLPQEPDLAGYATLAAYVAAELGPADDPHRATALLDVLGLSAEADPARLSGGEARRAALARVLAPNPDILLLDEPTNHLDLPAIAWLEEDLAARNTALVLISHDRRLLETVSRATVWLEGGTTRRMERSFAQFDAWRDEVIEAEAVARQKLARKVVAEEDWLRYGVTARRKRNVRRLAQLHELRAQKRTSRPQARELKLAAADTDISGKLVVAAKRLGKSLGERSIVQGLDLTILRGDRLGLIGPTGAGKTTLLRLLTGELAPDAGEAKLGASLEMVTLDQRRDALDLDATLADTLTGGRSDQVIVNGQARHVIGYMKDFLFGPEQARTPVRNLSGGEKGRLLLACALLRPCNLLVLDEPTNDLDLETLDLLQELLADHPATVLLVSHDRDFLDRVCTSVLAAEGEGRWIEYAGGYSDMLAQRRDAAPAADGPARSRRAATLPPPQAPARKLSFRDQHALDALPARIAALEDRIAKLRAALADPDLYTRDPALFARASEALATAEADLAAAEERWLELEMLREEAQSR